MLVICDPRLRLPGTTKLRNEWHLLNGLFFQQTVAAAVMQNDFKYIATQSVLSHTWFTQAIREFW